MKLKELLEKATKVAHRASHVDTTDGDHYSIVFDYIHVGQETARFYGENHREMADLFIYLANQADKIQGLVEAAERQCKAMCIPALREALTAYKEGK